MGPIVIFPCINVDSSGVWPLWAMNIYNKIFGVFYLKSHPHFSFSSNKIATHFSLSQFFLSPLVNFRPLDIL